ncbi:MAG: tetratricopeptide repeat protein [Acidobacteriota bacterium]
MGKRISKRQLREDEILTGFERAYVYVADRWRQAAIIAAIAVAAFAGVMGFLAYQESHGDKASTELAAAVDTFHATVVGQAPDPAASPTAKTYPSETDKYRDALKAFDEVRTRYAGTHAAKVARYYVALCHVNLGDAEQAAQELSPLTEDRVTVMAGLSRLTLASIARDKGEPEKAVAILQDKRYAFPPDANLFMQALVFEDQGLKTKAVDAYKEIQKTYTESPYAAEAKERRDALAPETPKGGAS